MTAPATLWTTEELPGHAFDPEPDDDEDGPHCRVTGLLPEQTTITVPTGSYL